MFIKTVFTDSSSFLFFFDQERHLSTRKVTGMIYSLFLSYPLLSFLKNNELFPPYENTKEEKKEKKRIEKRRWFDVIYRELSFLLTVYYNRKRGYILWHVVIVSFWKRSLFSSYFIAATDCRLLSFNGI